MSAARDLGYLCRELKHPSLLAGVERLAERARADAWSHEDFLAACLEREVSARQSHGGEARIHSARFPARKTLEDFDFDHQRSVRKDVVAHLGALDFIEAKSNAVFLGPPGTGKSHLSIALGIRACLAGHRVAFATAAEWVDRLGAAHDAGKLQDELRRLGRLPLVIIDLCRPRDYAEPWGCSVRLAARGLGERCCACRRCRDSHRASRKARSLSLGW